MTADASAADFYSTAAQVIVTLMLAYVIERQALRERVALPAEAFTTMLLLMLGFMGLLAALFALARGTGFTSTPLVMTGCIASVGLVLVPPFVRLARRAGGVRPPFAALAYAIAVSIALGILILLTL